MGGELGQYAQNRFGNAYLRKKTRIAAAKDPVLTSQVVRTPVVSLIHSVYNKKHKKSCNKKRFTSTNNKQSLRSSTKEEKNIMMRLWSSLPGSEKELIDELILHIKNGPMIGLHKFEKQKRVTNKLIAWRAGKDSINDLFTEKFIDELIILIMNGSIKNTSALEKQKSALCRANKLGPVPANRKIAVRAGHVSIEALFAFVEEQGRIKEKKVN